MTLNGLRTPIYRNAANSPQNGLHVYLNRNILVPYKSHKDYLEILKVRPPGEDLRST